MTASLKTTVLDDILTWSNKLPIWQRDALRRVITCETIEDMQIRELAAICRRSHGLAVDESTPSPKPLSATDVPEAAAKSREITLRSVSAVENVNALCGKQELKFGPNGITIVFGYNGSGKSGYGRILKRACRARRRGAIIPNVLAASVASSPPSAEFCYALDGAEQAPEQWVDGVRDIPALSAVSFFDAECANAHVGEKNDIAFSPFGLDVLPKLGDLIQKVRSILEQEKSAETSAGLAFLRDRTTRPHTRTGKFLSSLSPDTDVALLDDLAGLDEQEVTELAELRTALANDPVKVAQSLRNRASRIAQLQDIIAEAWDALNDDGMKRLHALATAAANKLAAANVAASGRFATEPIPEVGDAVWRVLWESARTYSLRAFPGRQFPSTGDGARCVLCQQLLDDDAKRRFNNFEQFIYDDTSKQAADAKASLDAALRAIDGLRLHDSLTAELLSQLKEANEAICASTRSRLAALKLRCRWLRTTRRSGEWNRRLPVLEQLGSDLQTLSDSLKKRAVELEAGAGTAERGKRIAQVAELEDRQWLGTVVGDVKNEIDRLRRVRALDACLAEAKTNAITAKSKALAKEHVTDYLRRAFASEVKTMQQGVNRIEVELAETSGEYGTPNYRIQLVGATRTPIDRVLSEGEHRCIALAGFLAELATQTPKSGVVFDDPVTSLDHRWRHCLADRLVKEAKQRQVIVFTHDIVFLHDISPRQL